jgi:hypothetical protein
VPVQPSLVFSNILDTHTHTPLLIFSRYIDLDLRDRHSADLDDINFSLATAAILVGSYAVSPSSIDHYYTEDDGRPRHKFALLSVVGGLGLIMPAVVFVHWVVSMFKTRRNNRARL